MLMTPLCELLSIDHPIVQGGMAWVSTAELVIAVSEAGGLGVLGAGNAPPDWVRDQIAQVRKGTGRPFGVNIPLFSPFVTDVVQLCAAENVPAVFTGGGNSTPYIEPFKEKGVRVIPVVASVPLAKRLERAGADALVAAGTESGGHIGDVATLPLVPQVVDAVDVPVIAAGGIADGRGLVASLALGAAGVQMGTRFVCVTECPAHPNYKNKILSAGDRATTTTGHSLGHPVRALKNPMVRSFAAMEVIKRSEEELVEFGTGKLRLACVEGDVQNGSVIAGQSSGLVRDVVSVRELVSRIVSEAEEIIASLSAMTAQRPAVAHITRL